MGVMTSPASSLSSQQWAEIDALVRRVDEDRWLSSRYAAPDDRRALVALYAFYYELAKVRLITTEPGLGAIRFQWWRDRLEEVRTGQPVKEHEVLKALNEAGWMDAPLERLIDGMEAALEAGERAREPEGELMRIAAGRLAETGWAGFDMVAVHFAGGRRGVMGCAGETVAKVPKAIRPAVAHGALRWVYASNTDPSPLSKRWRVMRAVMTGRI